MNLVILDRDGVINEDSDAYVKNIDEFVLLDGAVDAIKNLVDSGFKVAIATNQSGIGRGLFSKVDFDEMQDKLSNALNAVGAGIDCVAFCPHIPSDGCVCRKPLAGMIDEIFVELDVPADVKGWMVGDSLRDLQAGVSRGLKTILVKTGKGLKTLATCGADIPTGTLICDDLFTASGLIISEKNCGIKKFTDMRS